MAGGFSLYARGDTSGAIKTIPESTTNFYPGIYAKIGAFMVGNATYFPTGPYSPSDTTSVYGQLAHNTWFRGILWSIGWGDIETSEGVYDWGDTEQLLNMVGNPTYDGNIYQRSGLASAQNKKVLFLLDTKTFDPADAVVDHILPAYLQATGTAYANGMVRYHRLVGYESTQGQTGTDTQGYHLRWQYFSNGLSGNDAAGQPIYRLRDRFQAFLDALNTRFKDHPGFAGIVMTEPIPVADNIVDIKYSAASPDYNRDQFFDGRLQWLKNIKNIFTAHPIIEMPTFDNAYMQDMTNNNAPDGCVVNALGIGGPNFHNGTALQSIVNARNYAADKVVICNQIQGLDQDSRTGYYTRPNTATNPAPNDLWNFPSAPTTVIENPNFNASGQLISQDPPDFQFIMDRLIWLKTNIAIYQYITNDNTSRTTIDGVVGARYNWNRFRADMNGAEGTAYISPNTGASVKNDPNGGMITTVPQFLV